MDRKSGCVAAGARSEIGLALHVGEEARGAVGIEAGARRNADADAVGLEFLRAREARQRELGFGERQRAGLRVADHFGHHVVDQRRLARLFHADLGVARDHVPHLMREHRGELGLVVGERDQPAGDVEMAARQREGVDRRRVEQRHLVFLLGLFRGRHQAIDHLADRRVQLRIVIDAAIGGEDARVLALLGGAHRRRRARLRQRQLGQLQRDLAVVGQAGAAGERQRERSARDPSCRSSPCRHCGAPRPFTAPPRARSARARPPR